MGKCIASSYTHSGTTICHTCIHGDVCCDMDYITGDQCINYMAMEQINEWAKAHTEGRLAVLPCSVERIKDAVHRAWKVYGCMCEEIGIPNDYWDCRKECFQCVADGLRAEAEAALRGAFNE